MSKRAELQLTMEKFQSESIVAKVDYGPQTAEPNKLSSAKFIKNHIHKFFACQYVYPKPDAPLFPFDQLALFFFRRYFGMHLYEQLVALLKQFDRKPSFDELKNGLICQFGHIPEVMHFADCFLSTGDQFFKKSDSVAH